MTGDQIRQAIEAAKRSLDYKAIREDIDMQTAADHNTRRKVAMIDARYQLYAYLYSDGGAPLARREAEKFANVVLLAKEAKDLDFHGTILKRLDELEQLQNKHIKITKVGIYIASGFDKNYLPKESKREIGGVKLKEVNEAVAKLVKTDVKNVTQFLHNIFRSYVSVPGAYRDFDSYRQQVRRALARFAT